MPTQRTHRKPDVPRVALEAERVARQMYNSLTLKTAPKATPDGYIMGACQVLKMLIDQAAGQGADKEQMKAYARQIVDDI